MQVKCQYCGSLLFEVEDDYVGAQYTLAISHLHRYVETALYSGVSHFPFLPGLCWAITDQESAL
jgi:hypothetical protein